MAKNEAIKKLDQARLGGSPGEAKATEQSMQSGLVMAAGARAMQAAKGGLPVINRPMTSVYSFGLPRFPGDAPLRARVLQASRGVVALAYGGRYLGLFLVE